VWLSIGGSVAALSLGVVLVAAQSSYQEVNFWTLGNYHYNPKEPGNPTPRQALNTIPARIRALEGKKVEIFGVAVPLNYNSGTTTEFILNALVDECAWGPTPRINEWIHVELAKGTKAKIADGANLWVRGTFQIREEVQMGRVVGLYRIVAASLP
jgi:hypothetical protein